MGSMLDHLMATGGAHALQSVHGEVTASGEPAKAVFKFPSGAKRSVIFIISEDLSVGMVPGAQYSDGEKEEKMTLLVTRDQFKDEDLPSGSLHSGTMVAMPGDKEEFSLSDEASTYGSSVCTIRLTRQPFTSEGNFHAEG